MGLEPTTIFNSSRWSLYDLDEVGQKCEVFTFLPCRSNIILTKALEEGFFLEVIIFGHVVGFLV